MNPQKLVLLALLAVSSTASSATFDVLCNNAVNGDAPCEARVIAALAQMGCNPKVETLKCQISDIREGFGYYEAIYHECSIETLSCAEPSTDLLFRTRCQGGIRVSLDDQDAGLSLKARTGFRKYITNLCRF